MTNFSPVSLSDLERKPKNESMQEVETSSATKGLMRTMGVRYFLITRGVLVSTTNLR